MPREDVRFAVAAREDGLRRVRRLTFRIGAAGLACSAAIAIAFGHLSGSAAASGSATGNSAPGGSAGGSGGQQGTGQQGDTQQPGGGSLQAAHLALDPPQTFEVGVLVLGVTAHAARIRGRPDIPQRPSWRRRGAVLPRAGGSRASAAGSVRILSGDLQRTLRFARCTEAELRRQTGADGLGPDVNCLRLT